jgi:hypothetical protein
VPLHEKDDFFDSKKLPTIFNGFAREDTGTPLAFDISEKAKHVHGDVRGKERKTEVLFSWAHALRHEPLDGIQCIVSNGHVHVHVIKKLGGELLLSPFQLVNRGRSKESGAHVARDCIEIPQPIEHVEIARICAKSVMETILVGSQPMGHQAFQEREGEGKVLANAKKGWHLPIPQGLDLGKKIGVVPSDSEGEKEICIWTLPQKTHDTRKDA